MGIKENLKSKIIFIDTAPIIYYIEGIEKYSEILNPLFESNEKGDFVFITSTLTITEVLVQPIRLGRKDLVDKFKSALLQSKNFDVLDIDRNISIIAAEFKAKYNIKTPDAIQIATAIEYSADYFLTNDVRLKNISEIKVLTLD